MQLNSSVTVLNGVGTVKSQNFSDMGISSLRDLLLYFPRTYQQRGNVKSISPEACGSVASFVLTVGTEPKCVNIRRGMSLVKFRAFDENGSAEIVFFNQNYLKNAFSVGETYRFFGKLERDKSLYRLSSPAYERWEDEKPLPEYYPIYRVSGGITQKFMQNCVKSAFSLCSAELEEYLSEETRKAFKLCTMKRALEDIHNPGSAEAITSAARRLAFDEIFKFSLGVSALSSKRIRVGGMALSPCDMNAFYEKIGFSLTTAQKKCISDIESDMCLKVGTAPMNRMVIGDVGSGKTVCAAAAAYLAIKNGKQVAIMAPTEILALQHYNDLMPIFKALGYKTVLLIGSLGVAEKKKAEAAVSGNGTERADLVIGTHALISKNVKFAELGLVVADEQHRFGVGQRAALAEKGVCPHLLFMSATPIPRSLALVLYGELDVSVIDELPPGRQRVDTFVVDESYRNRINNFILKQTAEGGQVYIVCPSVEKNEDGEIALNEIGKKVYTMKSAVDYAEELSKGALSSLKIEFLHGKMKPADKDAVMARFVSGETQVLVATTVIEVGVNVPNTCLMIVENAERFGLSQLHQLRGRVGRGKRKSYCILVSGGDGETSSKRLEVMRTVYDGYKIAEEDLKLRGPGDFLPAAVDVQMRQHGDIKFKFTELGGDSELFKGAVEAARSVIKSDPNLEKEENKIVRRYMSLSDANGAFMN